MVVEPLPINLKSVTVEADRQYIDSDKSVFIPFRREKSAANSGQSLLMHLALPNISVDPISGSVSTLSGERVSFFIDFAPASSREVSELRPQDVKRVEVYDSPADPRFEGARHVVNFIMVRYEYGGYTRAQVSQNLPVVEGGYGLSSKFSYGRMTYDFSSGYCILDSDHTGERTETAFDFDEGTVVRSRRTDGNHINYQNAYATFRARYAPTTPSYPIRRAHRAPGNRTTIRISLHPTLRRYIPPTSKRASPTTAPFSPRGKGISASSFRGSGCS